MKKFFSISPLQPPASFKKGIYEAVDNEKLRCDTETGFPIAQVINGYAEENEEIKVFTVVAKHEYSQANYKTFTKVIRKIAAKKNIKISLKKIPVPYGEDIDIQLRTFSKLIGYMEDNDVIFADITYGTKPMSQILNVAINYGYRINENVSLGCIVYGAKDHSTNTMKIYDLTSMSYLDEIIRMFADKKIKNPTEHIKELLK